MLALAALLLVAPVAYDREGSRARTASIPLAR
jgi:hypothetical protein